VPQTADVEAAPSWLEDFSAESGLEGVVCKKDARYPRGNERIWLKVKRLITADVVVLGYVGDPAKSRLVVGAYEGEKLWTLGTTSPVGQGGGRRPGPAPASGGARRAAGVVMV
jgi:ATP-dependent DNA ligase